MFSVVGIGLHISQRSGMPWWPWRGVRAGLVTGLLLISGNFSQAQTSSTRIFGSGANQFSIDFVEIGNPNNAADTTGAPNPAGSVAYVYNLGKHEISRDMITKANAAGGMSITMQDMTSNGGNGTNKPATGITWYEAAKFVNWLNTSKGFMPAYKFDANGNFQLWSSGDAGYDANNPYRNSLAKFVMPSRNEWYKAAYGSPSGSWYDYPTGADTVPVAIAGGTTGNTVVYSQSTANGPSDITSAGGLSGYGTMGQGANAIEWVETAYDSVNDTPIEAQELRGGAWDYDNHGISSSYRAWSPPGYDNFFSFGFRVASADLNTPAHSLEVINLTPALGSVQGRETILKGRRLC